MIRRLVKMATCRALVELHDSLDLSRDLARDVQRRITLSGIDADDESGSGVGSGDVTDNGIADLVV